MKIYLAIPYTGMEEYSFITANRVAGRLMNEGHLVFSPISHTHPIAVECDLPKGYDFWKDYDTTFIEWCDELHVVSLIGWSRSKGVTSEIEIAEGLDKPVHYIWKIS